MNLLNHEPVFKMFGNGFQITFPNRYTVVIKNGPGAKCIQNKSKNDDDPVSVIMSARFGGSSSPNVEVEVYDPNKENISHKFGEKDSIGFVSTIQLVDLLYVVSSLKDIKRK